MALKQIKNKIRSVKKTHKVTKAMEAVSAVKMRKSQERALVGRPYAVAALSILKRLAAGSDVQQHPLGMKRDIKRICMIVITSDKGLAGTLNSVVLKHAARIIREQKLTPEDITLICMGKKGYDYFTARGYSIHKQYGNVRDDVSIEDMHEITTYIVDLFLEGTCDSCIVVYTNFISTFEQEPIVRTILPLSSSALEEMVAGITPERGKYAEKKETEKKAPLYMIEPDATQVLDELLPFLIRIELYHALLEAKASEHSARMVAMKNASDKAEEMSRELTLDYNKERQSLITREISEITGGVEAMTV